MHQWRIILSVERLLKRATREVAPGNIINLGIGLPVLLTNHLPSDLDVIIHSENGVLGISENAKRGEENPDLIDAAGRYVTIRAGGSFFDSAVSFAIVRRAKLDICMLGAFEVDQLGNLANWKIPGKFSPGIGGAMELAQKTSRVIVLCRHNDRNGEPKIKVRCQLPLTARRCVSRIITDCAVMDIVNDGLILREVADGMTVDAVVARTGADMIIPDEIGVF